MIDLAIAPRPIRSVLVANRGEIACRVIRTCKRLGLATIAVYSDADADALHVRDADAAIRIGPPAAAQSYLNVSAILDAARRSGADAIHPGYGFLSENAEFAKACRDAGLVFIGPSPEAIAAMGSKIEAKKLAEAAGVATVPGYLGDDQSLGRLVREAENIGYPVLIKASAGGGGRGMRRVAEAADMASALQSAKAEARAAFGSDAVLLEKLVANPRHLEVQLVGDEQGNLVHLFERDCSIQRNNQKVFEEAPAPHLPQHVREKLYERALRLGRTIGYTCAGTVEFIMDAGGDEPYFLEMNTRLQVEHPVTEAITGIDLVEWQIRVAAGLPLPARQEEIRLKGHAIEARIAAERPDRDYQPSTGTVSAMYVPRGARLDTGIAEGSEVGLHYDSMVAKLIAHGPDRDVAVANLTAALDEFAVLGVGTNAAFLRDCTTREAFISGELTTGFLAREFAEGWTPPAASLKQLRAEAAAAWATAQPTIVDDPWERRSAFRVTSSGRPAKVEVLLSDDFGEVAVTVLKRPGDTRVAFDDGTTVVAGQPALIRVAPSEVEAALAALVIKARASLAIDATTDVASEGADENRLSAPLPGVVTQLFAVPGAVVEKGESLVQMEAMKLIHTLTAPRAGRIARFYCAVGETVAAGAPLVDIDSLEEE
ncbi:MAG: ATP-grasp domain-containing protein [Phreatobacter sp.]|uniref:ATP-binding protein n=1 Tax=Phreatobacter sp. TaxID=1966341 RepID=UPI001A5F69A9|nr:biotin carboxylase N-terminal domain-containing protein [Phreatobacter sp.]MBL8571707.1 ATP-grasp domain-containing protein [Phreatobacter sp.]